MKTKKRYQAKILAISINLYSIELGGYINPQVVKYFFGVFKDFFCVFKNLFSFFKNLVSFNLDKKKR